MKALKDLLLPFSLTAGIVLADQAAKAIIVATVPLGSLAFSGLADFIWIIHARNPAVAFSLGQGLDPAFRSVLFTLLPLAIIGLVLWYYLAAPGIGRLQRWALCGILGGGIGNLIDRITRPTGVVDFVSLKFWGMLGLERWPTFNVADASVVVSSIVLVLALVHDERRRSS